MTDETTTDPERLLDLLGDVDGVITASRSEPIEGYDPLAGRAFEEVKITVEDGTKGVTGLLPAFLTAHGWHVSGAIPSNHTDARRRTVCITAVDRNPARVYALRSDDAPEEVTPGWVAERLRESERPEPEPTP